jgi:Holliday junction resolvase RusA-like endonuclease
MPSSWSEKKKRSHDRQPHYQRPDWDNLAKGLTDALFDEDCELWDVRVTKLWGRQGQIIIYPMESIFTNAIAS